MDVHNSVTKEIRAFLAAESEAPSGDYVLGEGSPYYTERERVSRKPMTHEEIDGKFVLDGSMFSSYTAFKQGVRFAEKHHGIGGDDE
jgi:hypothetical protein